MTTSAIVADNTSKNVFQCWLEGWKKSFNYKDRTSRYEFWSFVLINALSELLLLILSVVFLNFIFVGIYYFVSIFPFCALTVRRLHDIGKSGWWFGAFVIVMLVLNLFQVVMVKSGLGVQYSGFLMTLSVVGGVLGFVWPIVLFVFTLRQGNEKENRYGEPSLKETKVRKTAVFAIAFILVVFPVLWLLGHGAYNGYNKAVLKYEASQTMTQAKNTDAVVENMDSEFDN